MKFGVVGLGYWGPNIVRNFLALDEVKNVVCCDVQEERIKKIKKRFPMVETTNNFGDLLAREDVAAIAVATPLSTHYELARKVLEAGKHLMIEKPMCEKVAQAEELINLADKNNLTLLVDHTFLYTSAVRKIKELSEKGEIGDILYFDSVRVNLGLFQHDTNVIWDLAPHDISIMDFLIKEKPVSVSAVGVNHFSQFEDIAYINVNFEDDKKIIAHFHVNWISPVKVRKILIGGSKHMVVYDDMKPSEKVKVYDKGVEIEDRESVYEALVQYRIGDMYAPKIDQTEALSLMAKEFMDCIQTGRKPITDGESGLNVVKILEASDLSLQQGGKIIKF